MSDPRTGRHEVLSQFRLDGRLAFVSGATGHLGTPMARALAGAGAHVILNARRRDPLEAFAAELISAGSHVSVACFDIADEGAARTHIAEIAAKHGQLHVLVNNASSGRPGTLDSATAEDFDQSYRVNVVAAFRLLQLSLPLLKEAGKRTSGGASVINIASMYGS